MNIYAVFAIVIVLFVLVLLLPVFKAKDITGNEKWIFSFVVFSFFLSGGLLLYDRLGTAEIIPLMVEREVRLNALKEKIAKNSSEVKKNPENIKAWIELGDNFMESSQFSAAANAYKQTILLSKGNPKLIMAYVHALIIEANGSVTEEAKRSLDIVLMLQPENEQARYFAAVQKLQTGNMEEAMKEMKSLYQSLKDGSPLKDAIDRQIGRK